MKNLILKLSTFFCAFTFVLFTLTNTLNAQNASKAKQDQVVTINSKVLNEDRTVTVYLPENYEASPIKFPVVYLLDAKWNANHTVNAYKFLANQGAIPNLIIVSVHNVDRNRDFSPVHVEKIPTSGGADKFLQFVSTELNKHINDNYKTSGYDILIGHSFGGTFATYALLEQPETFDAYIAISPYLHFADNYLIEQAKTKLKTDYTGKKQFYMTIGDEPNYFEALDAFSGLVKEKCGDAINFTYVKMEDENHGTIPYVSVFKGLHNTFNDYQLNKETLMAGMSAIDEHYATISEKYGTKLETPEHIINKLGYWYLNEKNINEAIMVFTENTKRFPKSANVYDSLGEAYETNDQIELAAKNYKMACELGKTNNDKNLTVYQKNCERVQSQLSLQK